MTILDRLALVSICASESRALLVLRAKARRERQFAENGEPVPCPWDALTEYWQNFYIEQAAKHQCPSCGHEPTEHDEHGVCQVCGALCVVRP